MIICHVGPPWGPSGTHDGPKWPKTAPKWPRMAQNGTAWHFHWVYYMIICHVGPPLTLFRCPRGPLIGSKKQQKWPFMTTNGLETLCMEILHDILLCWTTLGPFPGPLGPCRPLKRPQGGSICHIIIYYAPEKCFRVILGHVRTFWVMKRHFGWWTLFIEASFWVMNGHFGAVLGHFRAPAGLWIGPRVVQHEIISSIIPMRSNLGPFWV